MKLLPSVIRRGVFSNKLLIRSAQFSIFDHQLQSTGFNAKSQLGFNHFASIRLPLVAAVLTCIFWRCSDSNAQKLCFSSLLNWVKRIRRQTFIRCSIFAVIVLSLFLLWIRPSIPPPSLLRPQLRMTRRFGLFGSREIGGGFSDPVLVAFTRTRKMVQSEAKEQMTDSSSVFPWRARDELNYVSQTLDVVRSSARQQELNSTSAKSLERKYFDTFVFDDENDVEIDAASDLQVLNDDAARRFAVIERQVEIGEASWGNLSSSQRTEVNEVLKIWRTAADGGCADAQFNLALAYDDGEGVTQNLSEAENLYRQASSQEHLEANHNLGNLLQQKGDLEGAEAAYREAIRIDPRDIDSHCCLGVVLQSKGELPSAEAEFRIAVQVDPQAVDPHYNLGIVLQARGEFEAAAMELREAIRIAPADTKAYFNLGIALQMKGKEDFSAAEVAYRKAIELDPKNAKAHNNLGVLLKDKDGDTEVLEYRKAIAIEPNYVTAHFNLGFALKLRGNTDEAAAEFREVLKIDPGNIDAINELSVLPAYP